MDHSLQLQLRLTFLLFGGWGSRVLFEENFSTSLDIAGHVYHSQLYCDWPNGVAVNKQSSYSTEFITGKWGILAGTEAITKKALVSSADYCAFNHTSSIYAEGFALLSKERFDPTMLTASLTAKVNPVQGSFVGVTLINNENDYREIAFNWYQPDKLGIFLYAPCRLQLLKDIPAGKHTISIKHNDYGWEYLLNGESLHFEPHTPDSLLLKNPRVGVYIVNEKKDGSIVSGNLYNVKVTQG